MLRGLLKSLVSRRATAVRPPVAQRDAKPAGRMPHTDAVVYRLAAYESGKKIPDWVERAEVNTFHENMVPEDVALSQLLAHVSTLVSDSLSAQSEARVASFAGAFSRAARPGGALNIFVFHVELAAGASINYIDAKVDAHKFDYLEILRRFVAHARRHCPGVTVYLVTSQGARFRLLAAEDVASVELPIDGTQPMYDRATAMLAYARSSAFTHDTVFLDSDAFVNRPLSAVFRLGFDLGLTYRGVRTLMPVNEGVIFAASRRRDKIEGFMQRRLATYDRLADDALVAARYNNIKLWRGGQLSLNALVWGLRPFTPYRAHLVDGLDVRFLPCDTFNFAFGDGEALSAGEHLHERFVMHYKGFRKNALLVAAKAVEPPATRSHTSERALSLDTTPPRDYEPPEAIDYERASLTELADHFRTDKGTLKHRYTEVYERYFAPLRGRPLTILEIGVACGASLKTWSRYFGPSAKVIGVDIRPECAALCGEYDNIDIRIGDAVELDPGEPLDIVIDDGSHVSLDIVRAFARLWPFVKSGGYFVVEDLRCTHDPAYARNFTFQKDPEHFRREHFVEWLDGLLRDLDNGRSGVDFVHCYPQLIVIRKR